jgi:tetratricopeptide (TPR) repeat protein
LAAIDRLDESQFAAAYALAAIPARLALERHDWKAAASLGVQPAWFPWNRFPNTVALVYYAKAVGAARAGDVPAARSAAEQIATIRQSLPVTRDYDWAGSIGAQLEAVHALIAYAEGKKGEGLRLLTVAADHEDAVDKHPVTPGSLLPVREILADLLFENGSASDALKQYAAVLKLAPRRYNATAGAARAAAKAGEPTQARAHALQLLEIAKDAESPRPELAWARTYLAAGK